MTGSYCQIELTHIYTTGNISYYLSNYLPFPSGVIVEAEAGMTIQSVLRPAARDGLVCSAICAKCLFVSK